MNAHESVDMDTRITRWCSSKWRNPKAPNALMSVISTWTPMIMVATIACAVFGFALDPSVQHAARLHGLAAIAAAVAARIINEPISWFFRRPRPFQTDLMVPLVEHKPGDSFPSNHATGAFALAMSMQGVPGYGVVLMVLAVFLAVSRVYVGLHYVTDIVVGAIHGSLAAWAIRVIFHALHITSTLRTW